MDAGDCSQSESLSETKRWTYHTRIATPLLQLLAPFTNNGLTLIPIWISNHKSVGWKYLFIPNFKGITVEVWEWISNSIPHFVMDVIIYPCHRNKGDPRAPFQYPIRRLIVRRREISKPRVWFLEAPVKFQSDAIIQTTSLVASILHEILR